MPNAFKQRQCTSNKNMRGFHQNIVPFILIYFMVSIYEQIKIDNFQLKDGYDSSLHLYIN
jgi:hypothetical protein